MSPQNTHPRLLLAMAATPASSPPSPSSQKLRVCTREACDTCRDKKAKCSGGRPCTRCAQRNIDCIYESRNYRTKRSLRDEIAALRQKNLEKDKAIEELRRQDANPNQDQAQLALLSPQSSVFSSTHERHHAVSTPSPSSQHQSPSFDAYHVPDANGAFADPNSESGQSYSGSWQLATNLLQADSTVSPQGVPLLNATNVPSGRYDPGFSLPWSGLSQAQGVGSMAPSELTRSFSAGLDATSLDQDVNPMFTLHNPDDYSMANNIMSVPQAGIDQPWDVYHPNKPAYAAVSPVSASENATLTAPTPPLSPSTSLAGLNDKTPPSPAAEHRPASRERHRLASARNWRKQKSATADLQAAGQRVEAEHSALQSQYAEVAEQVRFVKHALLGHAACHDPAISRWLENEAQSVGSRQARPKEQVGHGTGKRNHADAVEQAGSAKSQKQTISHGAFQEFTPPAYYWIRRAASNLHSLLDGSHETLQSRTIRASLDIGRVVRDFAAEALETDAGPDFGRIMGVIADGSGSAALLRSVAKAAAVGAKNTAVSDVTSASMFVGAGYAPDGEPDTDSVTLGLATRLSHVFTTLDNSITDLLRLVFAGQESANGRAMTFEAVRAGDAPAHPVVQFFDGGAFLLDVIKAEASRLEQSFRGAITNVQRSLISGLGLRVYIVKDSSQDGGALCAETGSREFDGYCWFLYRPAGSQPWTAEPLGHDVVMAFHHWGIDMEQVYCNAEACRAAHGFEGRGAFFDGIGDSVYGGQDSFG
ncbi:hypothetical protein BN1708_008730 [Verticillium longisporum]|uniref:Zn(2)-C6 fungal-type domain-containing protein n=1 Tax=Verticillium longisporum TaxID=100787 RepID=A0A0G4N6Q8_VERLO|nr:hypothetical protein BN1708_008730 [Verticillium longisporum]